VRSFKVRSILVALSSLVVFSSVGCGPSRSINPWALRKENAQLKTAIRQYQDQLSQAKIKSENLDADNEQLHNELATRQEEYRRLNEERQLASNTRTQGNRASDEDYYSDEKLYGQPAGGGKRGLSGKGTSQAGRDSSGDWSQMANISGAQVMRDGDAIRIRVTSTSLFDPGKATLKPGATKTLDQVANSIRRSYSGQLVGIEGHTDADPIRKSNWKDNHELSYQRARAVMEYLASRGGIPKDQLYIAAYGPNAPIASNKSSAGKAQNRRVEFVVKPSGDVER